MDQILYDVLTELKGLPFDIYTSRSKDYGPTSEIIGASLRLTNPRARLSLTETKGTIFSAIGELLWYLTKSNSSDFIEYYLKHYEKEKDNDGTIYGGYGPRLFGNNNRVNQIANVISLLKAKSSTRRAVVQLFEPSDISSHHQEIPCTCTFQFILRNDKLHMLTYMRSNDAFIGLPHDVFTFTMIQEIIARSIGPDIELGDYVHNVGSLHLYESNIEKAEIYLREGIQRSLPMPTMPKGDPWPLLNEVLNHEGRIRNGDFENKIEDDYWIDIIFLLQAFNIIKEDLDKVDKIDKLTNIVNTLKSRKIYSPYIKKRIEKYKYN